ncbi:hypothetical protein [[Kitasatospora] papulosa]
MTEPAHLAAASANAVTAESPGGMRRIATASFIGTAIEFYDYYIYGTAAARSST